MLLPSTWTAHTSAVLPALREETAQTLFPVRSTPDWAGFEEVSATLAVFAPDVAPITVTLLPSTWTAHTSPVPATFLDPTAQTLFPVRSTPLCAGPALLST
jgi:hypothetical protein